MTATIIDRLVVELGLDPKKYGVGVKEATAQADKFDAAVKRLNIDETKLTDTQKKSFNALRELALQSKRTGKELEATASIGEEFWGTFKKGALAFGAALGVEALKDLAVQSVQTNAALSRTSATLGMQAKDLDSWVKAIREGTGGGGGGVIGTLARINSELGGLAQRGQVPTTLTAISAILARNGGKPMPFVGRNGQAVPARDLLLSWADTIQGMGAQKASQAFGGYLDEDTILELSKGRKGVEADIAKAGKNTLGPEGYSDADKAAKSLNELADALGPLRDVLTMAGGGYMVRHVKQLSSMIELMNGSINFAQFQKEYNAAGDADPTAALNRATALMGPLKFGSDGHNYIWSAAERQQVLGAYLATGMSPESAAYAASLREGQGVSASVAAAEGGGSRQSGGGGSPGSGITDALLDSVHRVEGNGTSSAGAQGPYQFMPKTWAQWGNGGNVFDPVDARAAAKRYLTFLLGKYGGDTAKALAAYNWGPGALDNDISGHGNSWRSHLPNETSAYLDKVMGGGGIGTGPVKARSTTINHSGDIVINAPNGNPHAIAQAVVNAQVALSDGGAH